MNTSLFNDIDNKKKERLKFLIKKNIGILDIKHLLLSKVFILKLLKK